MRTDRHPHLGCETALELLRPPGSTLPSQIFELWGNDPIAALYTMRCAKLLQRPPPGDWDGGVDGG